MVINVMDPDSFEVGTSSLDETKIAENEPDAVEETAETETTEVVDAVQKEEKENVTMGMLLKTALLPVGSTMYIWGGGWNEEDTGAGVGATTIGLYPDWAEFAELQTESYNMEEHRYEIMNGLDCSGYIGWLIYNVLESESGHTGYVYKSVDMAKTLSELGFGEYMERPEKFLAGDIVSMKGHVWLSLGTCEDGSVLLLHSSPPGVSMCGTLLSDGSESEAVRLATKYMDRYAPLWQEKYPNRSVKHSYLNAVGLLRWSEDVLRLSEHYRQMKAEEIILELTEGF